MNLGVVYEAYLNIMHPDKDLISIKNMLLSSDEYDQYMGIKLALQQNLIREGDRLEIYFSGYGDSGDVDEIEFITSDKGVINIKEEDSKLILNNFLFRDIADYDWYNNDGGRGQVVVDLYNSICNYECYYNEVREVIEKEGEYSLLEEIETKNDTN